MTIHGVTTYLWFDNEALEAVEIYTSLFPNSKMKGISSYQGGALQPNFCDTRIMPTIVTITVSTVGGLMLMWFLLLASLAVLRPDGHTIRETSRILPDAIRLVRRLSHEQTLSRSLRIRLFLLLAYLAMPIDIVPDFIPVLGLADDAIILCLVLRGVIRNANHEVIRRNWSGTDAGLAVLARLCRIKMTPSSTL